MKITYLLFNGHGVGGTVRTVFNQANSMVARGHEVHVVTMWRTREETPFPLDERVHLLPLVDMRPSVRDTLTPPAIEDTSWHSLFPARLSEEPESRMRVNALIEYLRGVKDGVLVCTRPTIALIAERFSDPGLVRVVQEHAHLGVHKEVWRREMDSAYPSFDSIVTLTEADQRAYREAFPGARVDRIPNALHSLDVPQSSLASKVVVSAGRLVPDKRFDRLIKAFELVVQRHPDWTLRIYGEGPWLERLQRSVLKRHLYNHVFLVGPTRRLEERLAKGSIFALSSRSEGFGMALLEALSCGLPAVSFDCPVGPREIIGHGEDGLLVPPGDIEGLAEGICRLIEDEELRRSFGAAARRKAAAYGPDAVAESWERLYGELEGAKQR